MSVKAPVNDNRDSNEFVRELFTSEIKEPFSHNIAFNDVNDVDKLFQNDLFKILEESRNMVYKHTIKADAINEKLYRNKKSNTYGTLYDISGETASSVQFHLTDSTKNFVRGSLYFDVSTNEDSLKPIIDYLRQDILTIMETLVWSN